MPCAIAATPPSPPRRRRHVARLSPWLRLRVAAVATALPRGVALPWPRSRAALLRRVVAVGVPPRHCRGRRWERRRVAPWALPRLARVEARQIETLLTERERTAQLLAEVASAFLLTQGVDTYLYIFVVRFSTKSPQ